VNIALVSYEFPPETGGGGIGTYVANAARMLHAHGHRVAVFAGGESTRTTRTDAGVPVHRVACEQWADFSEAVVPVFAEQHRTVGFDVVEGPEYNADAAGIRRRFPDLPLVVKLHTASWMLKQVNVLEHVTIWDKLRFVAGALRRGRWPADLPWRYDPTSDPERAHVLDADVVSAPSRAIRAWTAETFGLDEDAIRHDPYPFEATEPFLDVPVDTDTGTVTFIGRLEVRKGVLDLADAIPQVLAERPDTRFRFVGRSLPHPKTDEDLQAILERRLRDHADAVKFLGLVPYETIPDLLADTDVCVFPSLWENFPNVCLEAMSAARGVVGSQAGGMAEMLAGGDCGNVVPPRSPAALADAILDLIDHPGRRKAYGAAARQRVLDAYSFDTIAPQQEACYEAAVNGTPTPTP
jgi:glycosyltransferase involved in cell wall biosynthesis